MAVTRRVLRCITEKAYTALKRLFIEIWMLMMILAVPTKKKGSFYRLRKQTHHNDYKFVRSINIKSAASGISDRTEEHLIRT